MLALVLDLPHFVPDGEAIYHALNEIRVYMASLAGRCGLVGTAGTPFRRHARLFRHQGKRNRKLAYLLIGKPAALRVHFSLGRYAEAKLEATWPSGIVDRPSVAANQVITVVEGKDTANVVRAF